VKCKRAKGVGVVSRVVLYDPRAPALKLKVVSSQGICSICFLAGTQGISHIRAVINLLQPQDKVSLGPEEC
jgi:hypothetical protein